MREEISKIQNKQLDRIIADVRNFLETEDGFASFMCLKELTEQIRERHLASTLSVCEQQALEFIKRNFRNGKSPSVRQLTVGLGFKSSRTGQRLLQSLRKKVPDLLNS